MRKLYLPLVLSVFLGACATKGSTPYLTSEPLAKPDSVSNYWVSTNRVQPLKYLTYEQKESCSEQNIIVKAKYLIDSNGDVFNVEIIEVNSDAVLQRLVERMLQEMDFQPSESNTALQPVIAYSKLEMKCEQKA
ncbi:MAG: hypothetical protein VX061_16060 [Pseudomonadota bacterium]|nr:hypothetical protein [Pseudomonadota bacterium]